MSGLVIAHLPPRLQSRYLSVNLCKTSKIRRKKEKKNFASSKKLLTSIKEKRPLGKKIPFTRKGKGGR